MFEWFRPFLVGCSDHIDLYPARGRMQPVQIRAYAPEDFAACRELYVLNEPGRFPSGVLPEFEAALQSDRVLFLVAEKDGEIFGCAGVGVRTTQFHRAALCFGLIHPRAQGQGLGTALLLARVAILPEDVRMVTLSTVPGSQGFYDRFNFRLFCSMPLSQGEEMTIFYVRISPEERLECKSLMAKAGVELALGPATVPVTP